jgi:hypothetical protein
MRGEIAKIENLGADSDQRQNDRRQGKPETGFLTNLFWFLIHLVNLIVIERVMVLYQRNRSADVFRIPATVALSGVTLSQPVTLAFQPMIYDACINNISLGADLFTSPLRKNTRVEQGSRVYSTGFYVEFGEMALRVNA